MEQSVSVQHRRLDHQHERPLQLLGGQQQDPLGGSSISIRRDHVRWSHYW